MDVSANIHDDTSKEVKLARLHELQARIIQMAREVSNSMVGTTQKVLVERVSKNNPNELHGRTENYKVVNFVGNARLINQIVDVKITEALKFTLRAEIILK